MLEKVQFDDNVPVDVALKFPDGKPVEGRFGDQMYYTTTDGRAMYLDMDTAAKVNMLGLAPRELFSICKRVHTVKGKRSIVWDVFRALGGPRAVPAPEAPSQLERQLQASIDQLPNRNGAAVSPATPHVQTVEVNPSPASNGNGTTHNGTANSPHVLVTDGRPQTKLESALKSVVAAIHSAEQYAASIGYKMPTFNSEDLRTMANTLIIDSGRYGAGNGNGGYR